MSKRPFTLVYPHSHPSLLHVWHYVRLHIHSAFQLVFTFILALTLFVYDLTFLLTNLYFIALPHVLHLCAVVVYFCVFAAIYALISCLNRNLGRHLKFLL